LGYSFVVNNFSLNEWKEKLTVESRIELESSTKRLLTGSISLLARSNDPVVVPFSSRNIESENVLDGIARPD
jgi:hypothetical protein